MSQLTNLSISMSLDTLVVPVPTFCESCASLAWSISRRHKPVTSCLIIRSSMKLLTDVHGVFDTIGPSRTTLWCRKSMLNLILPPNPLPEGQSNPTFTAWLILHSISWILLSLNRIECHSSSRKHECLADSRRRILANFTSSYSFHCISSVRSEKFWPSVIKINGAADTPVECPMLLDCELQNFTEMKPNDLPRQIEVRTGNGLMKWNHYLRCGPVCERMARKFLSKSLGVPKKTGFWYSHRNNFDWIPWKLNSDERFAEFFHQPTSREDQELIERRSTLLARLSHRAWTWHRHLESQGQPFGSRWFHPWRIKSLPSDRIEKHEWDSGNIGIEFSIDFVHAGPSFQCHGWLQPTRISNVFRRFWWNQTSNRRNA